MIKANEILNYLKNKSYKEKKSRIEYINKNNNILKDITLPKILKNLNIESITTPSFKVLKEENISQRTDTNTVSNNDIKESKALNIKKFNDNIKIFELFKKKNNINMDTVKKYLNIKKKKLNKGNDFCSFFLQDKPDYYINILNKGLINSFISFYSKAEKYYCNDIKDNCDENELNNISLKINNIQLPMFILKQLNNNNLNFASHDAEKYNKDCNIYERCSKILDLSLSSCNERNCNNYFLRGLNHDIKYDLENYLNDKIKLFENNNDNNLLLYENKNFVKKYSFQFIKDINNALIDKKNIIKENNLKYSFNNPRIMYPLFLNSLFDNSSIFTHCSFFKTKNKSSKTKSKTLNLFFLKNIDREHDTYNINFENNVKKSYNFSNNLCLLNPLKLSSNKELNANIFLRPKKLDNKLKDLIGNKNRNKNREKRRYLDIVNSNKKNKNDEIKLIMINNKNVGKLLNNIKEYIVMNSINEFDFLFDFNICGKMIYTSEFMDEFEYNGYNNLIDLINNNYLYYSIFYIFIIDDEQLNKKEDYSVNKIVNKINQIIKNKFSFIMNNSNYQLDIKVRVISNPHLINYEINNIYNEIVENNFNNPASVYNVNIFDRIKNYIKNNETNINDCNKLNNKTEKFNVYENYFLNIIQDDNLKEQIDSIINIKYSKRNIL